MLAYVLFVFDWSGVSMLILSILGNLWDFWREHVVVTLGGLYWGLVVFKLMS